jgi:hypothetical protein
MAASLRANVAVTGSLSFQGTWTSFPSTSNNSVVDFLIPITGFSTKYNGSVGLGLTPTSYQLDLSTDNARKLTTSTWTTVSDARTKINIETANLVRCAEIVDTLNLKYFEWTLGSEDRHALGWIAQDVAPLFPNSVSPDSDGFLMLNSDQLIKVLYGALKQTQLEFFPS